MISIKQENTDKERAPLKGRAKEIYLDLLTFIESMPSGCPLPSIRELQRKYSAGQMTIVNALKMLNKNNKVMESPRKKIKVSPEPSIETPLGESMGFPWIAAPCTTETVLVTSKDLARPWQPIIDRYNLTSPCPVKINALDDLSTFFHSRTSGDFVLFPTNPVLHGLTRNTSMFMDMNDMAKSLAVDEIYSSAFVIDPDMRLWGIAPTLTPYIIFRNTAIDRSPDIESSMNWNFEDFGKYLENLKNTHPQLPYIYSPLGYVNAFFSNWGIPLVDPETGKVKLDPELLSAPMKYLRNMIDRKIVPIFSDVYNGNYRRFFNQSQSVMRDGWISEMNKVSEDMPAVDILAVPSKNNYKRRIYSEMFSIMTDSMNYDRCWDFICYVMSEETQQYIASLKLNLPARKNIVHKGLSKKQYEFISRYLELCERKLEDYYIPFQSTSVIEAGIDRWIKHGGEFNASVLKDIEKSCQWHIDNMVWK